MPRAARTCTICPAIITTGTRCPEHARQHERARGTRQQRGYDTHHDLLRARWSPHVAAGGVNCWRCNEPIEPGTRWHLGHDDHDRTIHRGPEHERCNTAAPRHLNRADGRVTP